MRRLLGSKTRAKVGNEILPSKTPSRQVGGDAGTGAVVNAPGGVSSSRSRSKKPAVGSSSGASSSKDDDPSQSFDSAMDLVKQRMPKTQKSDEDAKEREWAKRTAQEFSYGSRSTASPEERKDAAMKLAKFVNEAFGVAAATLGAKLRESRGLAYVLQLLYEGDIRLQRAGLMILANLASDAFDPGSAVTKRQVLQAGVFGRIKDFVFAADGVAQTYACACLQNLAKDVKFAKLIRAFELVEELERLVNVSPNEHLKRFAAGALFNTVEAIHREAQLKSLDSLESKMVDEREGDGTPGRHASSNSKGMMGVLGTMFAEREEEVELSDEVVAQLAKREAEQRDEDGVRAEAAAFIQGVFRKNKTIKAFRMLKHLATAIRVVTRFMLAFIRRRRRKAILIMQTYTRAFILDKMGICKRSTALAVINGTRRAYHRSLYRTVTRRFVLFSIEEKRRQAAAIAMRQTKSRGGGLIRGRLQASRSSGHLVSLARSPSVGSSGPVVLRRSNSGSSLASSAGGGRGSGFSDRSGGSDESSGAGARPRQVGSSTKGGSGSNLVNTLLPRTITLPRVPAVSTRIPLYHPKKTPGMVTPQKGSRMSSRASSRMHSRAGSPKHSRRPSNDGIDLEAGSLDRNDQSPSSGAGTGMQNPVLALQLPLAPTGLVAVAASRAAAAAAALLQPSTDAPSEADLEALERRRTTAAAARYVLDSSLDVGEFADEEAPPSYLPPLPIRRHFPPGASAAKFQTFCRSASNASLAFCSASSMSSGLGASGPLQTSTSYAGLPTRQAAALSGGSGDENDDEAQSVRSSVSSLALVTTKPADAGSQRPAHRQSPRHGWNPAAADLDEPDIDPAIAAADLEAGWRAPATLLEP